MKQLFTLIFLVATGAIARAQDVETAGQYMGFISKQQENISKKYLSYTSAAAHGKRAKKVDALREKLIDEVQEARMNINGLPAFKGDKSYRDTAVSFMKLYYNVLNDDYAKIINMEEVAEKSYDDMEAYMMAQEMVDKRLKVANEMMQLAQKTFAAKNNINLLKDESDLGEMLEQVHKVNDHYKEVYLIFFKPYKQEAYLMEAVSKGNITGIEQNKNALLKYAQQGLEKLNTVKPFMGDNSLVAACKASLNFYVKEVTEKINTVSDYYLKKEQFAAIKKEFEKKDEPTRAEVDTYNKGIVDINKASDAYNKNNQSLNQARKEALDNWNNTMNTFFNEHTPRYK
jgi:predicted DNA-binding protein